MGKSLRKRRPHGNGGGEIITIDLESSTSDDCFGLSSHRTCWKHLKALLHSRRRGRRRRRITKQQAEEIERCKLTSPCFSHSFPQRERTKRHSKRKNAISKLKEKLDTGAFNCYLENLWKSFSEDKMMSFAYLDSLWFSMYMEASSRPKVLEWIKRKHIFSKKYVVVPIVCWSHWSLLVFCNLGESSLSENRTPCMLLLDSLEMAKPKRLEPDIRKFLLDIYKSEGRAEDEQMISQIPLLVPKVPQQSNDKECGNYVLYFINLFVQDAPENFSMDGYPYFMKDNWFTPEGLKHFCEKLESLDE